MKQRVQDLEQQLCEMRARQQQAQYAYGPEYTPALNPDGSVCMPPGGPGVSSIWQPSPAIPRHPGMPPGDMWATNMGGGGPEDGMMGSGFPRGLFAAGPEAGHGHMHHAAFGSGASSCISPLNLPTTPSIDQLPPSMLATGDLDGHQHQQPVSPMHKLEADEASAAAAAAIAASSSGSGAWSQSPYLMSPASSRLGTVPPGSSGGGGGGGIGSGGGSSTPGIFASSSHHSPWGSIGTTATDRSDAADANMAPTSRSSLEDRFEYVLDCARQVGFDTFDSMAAQYYATNFEPSSSLAMDQRVSRNRHLPALLADLRQNSADWSTWERRGYQDETLKAAEEICAAECRDFRAAADPVTLATVQQKVSH